MDNKKTPKSLHEAVRSGNIKTVEAMLTRGADVNSQSFKNNKSTLHIAVENNNIEMVKFLLSKDTKVVLKDCEGETALRYALVRGHLEMADLLIKAEADVNSQDNEGLTALMIIQLRNKSAIDDLKLTQEMLARGANVNIKASNGFTALMFAAMSGNFEVAKLIIDAGADINHKSDKGTPALHIAVQKNNMEMVKALISRAADINIQNSKGLTALHVAIEMGNFDLADYLIKAGIDIHRKEFIRGCTALHLLVFKTNNISLTKKLLSRNVEVDLKDSCGFTALSIAFLRGALEVADLLIDAGGDVNSQNKKGFTALNLISNPQNRQANVTDGVELAKELLSRGVDVDIPNSHGQTALHTALSTDDLDLAKYLASAGADVNCQDNRGYAALHFAATHNTEMVKCLLSRNAKVNIVNNEGETALHIAVQTDHIEIADYLVEVGIDVNCRETSRGLTALHLLVSSTTNDKISLVRKLLSRNDCKVDVKDLQGMTALNHALILGNLKMADILINAGGNVNSQDNHGSTSLCGISHPKNRKFITDGVELAKELLKRNVDVNIPNFKGTTALHFALANREMKIAKCFINAGADVNCQEERGNSVLHLAAMNGDVSLVHLCLSQGADINAKNNEGNTALHISTIYKEFKMIQELLSLGSDASIRNNLGNTAFETAIFESKCHFLAEHFSITQENTKFQDATFTKRQMNAIRKTPQFQYLKTLGADEDLKDLKSLDPIHSLAAYNLSDLNKKVTKKLSKNRGNPRAKNGASGLALFDFEHLKNDCFLMLFFNDGFYKLFEK